MINNDSSIETKKYINRVQMLLLFAFIRIAILKWGRRTGKTAIGQPVRILQCAKAMPRSSGALAGYSYRKLADHLLPEIIAGWKGLGLIEDEHFWVCKAPPKHIRPYIAPRDFDHYITFANGAGFHIISFNHGVTSNGLATDWLAIDEAKQLNPDRVDSELFKTMSGHRTIRVNKHTLWGDLPQHLSITLTSDGFIGKKDFNWITRYSKDATPFTEIYKIMILAEMVREFRDPILQRELMELCRNATLYSSASTEENLAVLGIEYFKTAFKNSSPLEFRASILNEDVNEIEGGFYSLLDMSVHGYSKSGSGIDRIGMNNYLQGKGRNSSLDDDLRKELPLKLCIDYGSRYSWAVVYQHYFNTYHLLKNFWVETPKKFTDMVQDFCNYYANHPKKVVELYDDPGGHKERTDTVVRDVDEVKKVLYRNGWSVRHKTEGNRYIKHTEKYRIWEKVLDERESRDSRYPRFRINEDNGLEASRSMMLAPVKQGFTQEFQKDKSSEKSTVIKQWNATHLSDCADMAVCTDYIDLFRGNSTRIYM